MRVPSWITWAFLVVSFLGFVDAAYLTINHYTDIVLPCTIISGCESVTSSSYAVAFGVPVALWGAVYYLAIFFGAVTYRETQNARLLKGMALMTTLGLLASAWFIFVQVAILKAICQYCMLSAATSTTLFIVGMLTLRTLKTSGLSPLPREAPSAQS